MKRGFLVALLALGLASTFAAPANAQNWPSKTVSMVVPFTAGGSTDTVARLIAERLAPKLGQPVIVENRAGVGGALGSDYVAKSPADGYTLLVGTASTMAIAPHVYTKLPYQPVRDLSPITLLGTADIMIVVRSSLPIKTVPELLDYAKANPGKLTFASGGNGSISHLLGEYFKSMAKVDLNHVPYRGDAQMVVDLIGGQVDMAFGTAVAFLPHVKTGKVTALAVTNPKRSTTQTQLPTVGESGVPGYEAVQWFGIAAPAGTPKPVMERLNREIVSILAMPDVRKRFGEMGFDVVGNTPEEFKTFLEAENKKWKMVADVSGTKLD
ncbi:tripartite tricarboxylate transporter substrate binding protein [Burkholderiaceae bacterium FT117]|uniref:Bug family tripartite tricarboxylate transporter substrate binding protein n=1 Tax=Zeimonas sediminis TaxID=2944268 RepID=UPI002342D6A5|nr:tripartite tricarboxylate transporter substrate binding protein [Zeimonas sediminis]MCM5570466.1 tripartite tricarboxylate transporter substrate binding protein [Zeimonas sediminis]